MVGLPQGPLHDDSGFLTPPWVHFFNNEVGLDVEIVESVSYPQVNLIDEINNSITDGIDSKSAIEVFRGSGSGNFAHGFDSEDVDFEYHNYNLIHGFSFHYVNGVNNVYVSFSVDIKVMKYA